MKIVNLEVDLPSTISADGVIYTLISGIYLPEK
jgi:hypothetical protein